MYYNYYIIFIKNDKKYFFLYSLTNKNDYSRNNI